MNSSSEHDSSPASDPDGQAPARGPMLAELWQRAELFGEIHVMRLALIMLAGAAALGFLHYAASILIPIVLAVFLAYVLDPPVTALTRARVPRWAASFVVVVAAMALAVVISVFIVNEIGEFASDLPAYRERIQSNVDSLRADISQWQDNIEGFLEPIRRDEDGLTAPESGVTEQPGDRIFEEQEGELWASVTSYVFGSITSVLTFGGQAAMCLFVLFFILLEGPVLKTKVINIMGTSLRKRRVVLEILHNVNEDVQRYLFNRVLTNAVLAVLVGLIFYWYGLDYAFLVGVLAGIFNFVPYVGPIIGSVVPALIAYMQYGDLENVLWCVTIYAALTGTEGNLITPIVLGRHLKLNSLAVLLGCIFWGWLWGPIGLLLAVPIMAVLKAVSEHIDGMRPVGELLRG